MAKETCVGVELDGATAHYVASLADKQDHAGLIQYYEDNRDAIEAAGIVCAGEILHRVAKAYASLADYPTALRTARVAQNRVAENGDSLMAAEIFVTLGGILRSLGELKEAERAFRDAESIFRRNDCLEGQSRALNMLAGLLYRQNEYGRSLSVLMDATAIARRLGDRRKLAYMMGNIGRIHTFVGEFSKAREYLQLNIDLSTESGDRAEVTRSRIALGYAHLQEGTYATAEEILKSACLDAIEAGTRRDEAICLSYLGELEYRTGRLRQGRQTLRKALTLAEQMGSNTSLAGRIMRHLAEVSLRQTNLGVARRWAAKASLNIGETGDKVENGALCRIKAAIAEAEGDNDQARELYMQAIDGLEEVGVCFETAEALVAAGKSRLFPQRRQLTFLFRAETLYAHRNLSVKRLEVEELISNIEYPAAALRSNPETAKSCPDGVDFLTNSGEIRQFKDQLPAIGRADLPLLLTGETGVGKDHMARYFHHVTRPGMPFVTVNCASVPETLLESELFGYHRGAFTGADTDKQGLFMAADGGVLLLDEIGDMPLQLQTKLLGVLERKKVTPLGSTCERDLDIKLVTATNKDLQEMVETGGFRRDLYYRLSGLAFCIPPLRERKEDISILLAHFLVRCGLSKQGQKVSGELLRQFLSYSWPGNTRELYNRVRRLEVMADLVADSDLAELSRTVFNSETPAVSRTLFERVEQFERQLITEALVAAGGNKSEAARLLGIHEATVRTKLKRYGIQLQKEAC